MGAPLTSTTDNVLSTLHPDCPDWQTLGPTTRDAALRAAAERTTHEAQARDESWSRGFNRRTFLKGGLGVGVAALGTQLVTSRVAYASAAEPQTGTLVVIFLRGGVDGLSLLVPASEETKLAAERPDIRIPVGKLIAMDRGFGLHPAMAPLQPLITAGKVAAIPAVSTPDLSRSHFQAQDCLERGSSSRATSGWLDRVLQVTGPGTTFRSVSVGGMIPRSLLGTQKSLGMYDLDSIKLEISDKYVDKTMDAIATLYTGLDHPIGLQALMALDALDTVQAIRDAQPAVPAVTYPKGNLGDALSSLAQLIKAGAGVKVACLDVGGWDTHTGMGNVDAGDMKDHLSALATALAAFTTDIGSALNTTTILTMSEFGRRVEQNASGGTDHGHGGVVLAIGGGVKGGVHGTWNGLADNMLEQGDIPGSNDYRDVLGEIVMKRLDVSAGAMSTVFPNWTVAPVGVMA